MYQSNGCPVIGSQKLKPVKVLLKVIIPPVAAVVATTELKCALNILFFDAKSSSVNVLALNLFVQELPTKQCKTNSS